jgi:hypothetical protein
MTIATPAVPYKSYIRTILGDSKILHLIVFTVVL